MWTMTWRKFTARPNLHLGEFLSLLDALQVRAFAHRGRVCLGIGDRDLERAHGLLGLLQVLGPGAYTRSLLSST